MTEELQKLIAYHDALVMEHDKRNRAYMEFVYGPNATALVGMPGLLAFAGPDSHVTVLSVMLDIHEVQQKIVKVGEKLRFAQRMQDGIEHNIALAKMAGEAYGVKYSDDGIYEQTREIVAGLSKPRKPRARAPRKPKEAVPAVV